LGRWVGIEVVSLTIEIFILGLATYIILMLQMPMKAKSKGIFAFMTRLP
jgi:phage shock protein PspC (stress-responsive transcriptional regulator)